MAQRPLRAATLFCCAAVFARVAFVFPAPTGETRRQDVVSVPGEPQAAAVPRAVDGARSGQPLAVAAILALASCSAVASARRKQSQVQRQAEGASFLDSLQAADRQDQEEAVQAGGGEMQGGFPSGRPGSDSDKEKFFAEEINENDLEEFVAAGGKVKGESENARFARQEIIELNPSKQYVNYIAKKNAQKTWAQGKNDGGLEVQIAILTENIRNQILHCRENKHDYKARLKLVSKVAKRRLLLDKLSEQDLGSYMKIREGLKIRHVYRMQALIGRLDSDKYGLRHRPPAPGRKVLNRLKKSRKLLTRRLASQLRQGKSRKLIHTTKKRIAGRRWTARSYDEAKNLLENKAVADIYDPLELP